MEARESSPSGAHKSSSKGVEEKPSCSGVVESLKQDGKEQIQKVEDAPLIGVLVEAAAALEADAVARGSEEVPSTAPPVTVEVKTVENISVKRKRGRPPKDAAAASAAAVSASASAARGTEEGSSSAPVSVEVKTLENNSGKRPRGRPPKEAVVVAIDVARATEEGSDSVPASAEVKTVENSIGKRTRGRPPKEAVVVAIDVAPPAEEGSSLALASVEAKTFDDGSEKRKRGRPPKGLPKLPQPVKKKKDEEDVCFICFDGGSLVLCDRRGCPKAYHPSCVKRDEAFFQSKARWDCGWHICSNCEKPANYMCYTCTYSLCKACTRDADYVCVRENKGFCSMCMKTIMLIEKKDQKENETVVVDFDDKSSWEYLFKMYWLYSKQKLSLTLDELTKARNPWSVDGHIIFEGRDVDAISGKNDLQHPIFGIPSESKETKVFCGSKGSNQHTKLLNGNVSPTINTLDSDEGAHVTVSAKWASKELLAFVAHVKNGDISQLSIQDAQALLSDYVKKNNLPDPSQKSQIICDARLSKLFGKPRVGHIEMLKLLEFHFPIKDDSLEDVNRSSVYPAVASQANSSTNSSNFLVMGTEIKSKTLKMVEDKGPPANLHEYAAVDVHNISLIYLRRSLLENLIDESGKLHNIAVGSFVRIGVSGGDHEQDIFRLVQVVGTCMIATPYKIGEKSVNVALEILNLDKKEAISISALSNQNFSEDECRRLRESIKCGLVKHLTVGQILEKSKALREVLVNDWLENEVIRLNRLRDQANEKGQEKELREFVEKIELMKSPEERQRRLLDVPEIHIDRHMKVNSQSDEGAGLFAAKNQAAYGKTRGSGLNINEKEAISSKDSNKSYPTRNKKSKVSSNNIDKKEIKSTASDSAKPSNGGDKGAKTDVGGSNTPAAVTSIPISGISSEASVASLSTGTSPPPLVLLNNEADNLWHYRDPDGNIQGPFCLLMLRKWSSSGYFPPDLRIWSIYDKEGNSLLLLNLLKGQPPNKPTSVQQPSRSLPSQEVVVQVTKENASNISLPSVTNLDNKQSANCQDKLESASWTSPPAVNCIDINKSGSPCLESAKVNDLSSTQMETSKECGNDDENRICRENNDRNYFSHSSGNSWRPPIFTVPPNKLDLNTSFSFETKSNNSSVSDIPILPNPNERSKERQSELLNVHIQGGTQLQNPPKPTLNLDYNMEEKRVPGSEKKQSLSLSSNFVVRDSGPTWSSSSGLFLGGGSVPPPPPQSESPHPEGSNAWVGHPPAAKAPVEELGLGLIPVHSKAEPSNNYPPSTDNSTMISPTHPTSGWLAMVTEPIELSTLAEESVSDLLAEVDALESQGGLPSPTSAMNYVDYLFEDTVNDCFNPIGPMSRTINSTGNVHLAAQQQHHHHQSSNIQETPLQADRHTEVVRTGKPNNNWQQKDSSSHIPESSSISHDGIKRASWPTNLDVGLGNMNSGWEGGGGITAAAAGRVNGNVQRSGPGVYTGGRDGNSSRYGGERVTSQSGRHGGGERMNDQNRQSLSWSRHSPSVGSGGSGSGGGNYSRGGGGGGLPPPSHKGGQQQQRVCKFYESGRCKKGAYCDYLHP